MVDLQELVARFNRDHRLDGDASFPTELTAVDKDGMVAEFRARYASYNLVRKLTTDSVSESQRQDAFDAHIRNQLRGAIFNSTDLTVYEWLGKARDIVHRLLPPLEFIWDEIWPNCQFGPGTFNGAKAPYEYSLHYKIGGDQTVTAGAKALYISVLRDYYPRLVEILSKGRRLKTLEGNRLSHVAKDANKCRPISIEPSGNVFLQQGIGRWMMKHFRKEGFLDLFHGQDINRRAAGTLSNGTIDLSNASDTIYTSLVRELLPADWFTLLDMVRSQKWAYRDEQGVYENFCSQGNAFTFPLESLIFKAICMAATDLTSREVIVYGDDMILPVEYCPRAVEVLGQAGFIVNNDKSYYGQHTDIRKYFRESCGADYFFEVDVTPVYIRKQPKRLSDLAAVYNRIWEEFPNAKRTLSYILFSIPENLRKFLQVGPEAFVTDRPERWVVRQELTLGVNSVVKTYSQWFWNVGPLRDHAITNRAYCDRPRKLPERLRLGDDVSLAVFLYGGSEVLPRNSKGTTRPAYVTPASPEELGELRLRGRKTPWWEATFLSA